MPYLIQVMREYTSKVRRSSAFSVLSRITFSFCSVQVDKLEEAEKGRLEEKKENEYKPVVMGT